MDASYKKTLQNEPSLVHCRNDQDIQEKRQTFKNMVTDDIMFGRTHTIQSSLSLTQI